MDTSKQIAKNILQVYFGGNWTEVNIKDTLSNISWKTAIVKPEGFNSILALTYHIHYFVNVQLKFLKEHILVGKDSESYNHPKISSQSDWENLQKQMWIDAKQLSELISELPNSKLNQPISHEKYGTYSANFIGLLEHTHYHLGQIVLINKMISNN